MDINLLRTFIQLEESGTMSLTAQRLFITQATVSARIAQLEDQLEARLFVRSKSGTRLTPEGKRLLPHAQQMLQTWETARQEVSGSPAHGDRLNLGGELTLSTSLLPSWLVALRKSRKNIALRAVVDSADRLLDSLARGDLDVAALYSPLRRPLIKTQLVLKEELICVTTHAHLPTPTYDDYVYVDWGPDFSAQHERLLPGLKQSATIIALGPLALRYLLRAGGSGYFRTRAVAPFLRTKQLRRLPKMPKFTYSIYAAASPLVPRERLEWALDLLTTSSRDPIQAWA